MGQQASKTRNELEQQTKKQLCNDPGVLEEVSKKFKSQGIWTQPGYTRGSPAGHFLSWMYVLCKDQRKELQAVKTLANPQDERASDTEADQPCRELQADFKPVL